MKIALLTSIILIGSIATASPAKLAAPVVTQLVGGDSHTCALFSNQKVKCWGAGTYGQHGLETYNAVGERPNSMGDKLPYVNLGTGVMVEKLIGGDYATCAITTEGKMKCWGYGGSGGLANGKPDTIGDQPGEMGDTLAYADLGTTTAIKDASGGYINYCALFMNSKVKCWGYNYYGELGLGDNTDRGATPTTIGSKLPYVDLGTVSKPVKLSVGRYHSCALFENGKAKCWGYNSAGELGLGDANNRGDQAGEMGNNLPFIDLGGDQFAIDIEAGEQFTCALIKGGKVKCWGAGFDGRTGYGDTSNRGDNSGEMGDMLPFVDLGDGLPVTELHSQIGSICAVFLNGTAKCWGNNMTGALGYGDTNNRGDNGGEMGEALDPVYLGRNAHVVTMMTAGFHSCAVISSAAQYRGVKCWGYNSAGQLGLESTENIGDATGEMTSLGFVNLGSQ